MFHTIFHDADIKFTYCSVPNNDQNLATKGATAAAGGACHRVQFPRTPLVYPTFLTSVLHLSLKERNTTPGISNNEVT